MGLEEMKQDEEVGEGGKEEEYGGARGGTGSRSRSRSRKEQEQMEQVLTEEAGAGGGDYSRVVSRADVELHQDGRKISTKRLRSLTFLRRFRMSQFTCPCMML